ncbi:MAG: DUF5123 domain-containing protein [Prevotella sp.]|nr:DUF5123 domain-containing protein [Prevotella sp.]
MKTINKILGFSAMALLGLFSVSCVDGNDWDVDSAYNRLFSVGDDNITVTADTTSATVEFSSVSGAEYYIIEVSEDSLYNDIALGGTSSSIVYGQDGSITSSPVVIDGLSGETKYYLRMKSYSSTTTESHWAYYKSGGTFKTLAEQLFYDLADDDVSSTSVHVTWPANAEVTHLGYKTASQEDTTMIALDAATIAAGEYTFEDLQSTTTYTFFIFNGNVKRGSFTVTTVSAAPDADFTYTIPSGTTRIDQDLMSEIVAEAQEAAGQTNVSITISLPAGEELEVCSAAETEGNYSSLSIPEGISVTFWCGSANKATLKMIKSLEIGGYHNSIGFENVILKDNNDDNPYIINQTNACTIGEVSFKSVEINDLDRSLFRLQNSNYDKTIGKLTLDDCVITNQGSGNYAFILYKDANIRGDEVEITNCTFNTMQYTFIQCAGSNGSDKITIENCTFYNSIGSGRYLVDAQDLSTEIYLTNLVLAKTYVETGAKGGRTGGSFYCTNVLQTNDFVISSNDIKADMKDDDVSSSDLFVDPENGDFTIQINKYAEFGDPRWYPADE